MGYICKKCNSTDFYIKLKPLKNGKGSHTGLYCKKCKIWKKWLTQEEKISLMDKGVKEITIND
jgi:hypothetical protein